MTPDISIVMATRNRLPALQATCATLAEQDLSEIEAELIVVDNGSDDGTATWLDGRKLVGPLCLRVVRHPRPGASAARNRGVTAACGRIVLFLNDDTRPADPGLLRAHVRAHAEREDIAVLGRARYPTAVLSDPFMAWLEDGPQFAYRALERGEAPGPSHFYSAHLSFSRARYLAVGGMDERIPYLYEDSELGVRMTAAGVRLVYRPELVVIHDHPTTLQGWARRMEQVGAAGALVNRIHPAQPPIAMIPQGARWRVVSLVGAIAGRIPTAWAWAPDRLRRRIYGLVHAAGYVRGYVSATTREPPSAAASAEVP